MGAPDSRDYAIVASNDGSPRHPVWHHNVKANPELGLQDGTESGRYVAREVTGEAKQPPATGYVRRLLTATTRTEHQPAGRRLSTSR